MFTKEESVRDIYETLNRWPKVTIDDIIDMAISRHCVKKGREPHIKKIIETAFKMVMEQAKSDADLKKGLEESRRQS
jgi:hypothetical protein